MLLSNKTASSCEPSSKLPPQTRIGILSRKAARCSGNLSYSSHGGAGDHTATRSSGRSGRGSKFACACRQVFVVRKEQECEYDLEQADRLVRKREARRMLQTRSGDAWADDHHQNRHSPVAHRAQKKKAPRGVRHNEVCHRRHQSAVPSLPNAESDQRVRERRDRGGSSRFGRHLRALSPASSARPPVDAVLSHS